MKLHEAYDLIHDSKSDVSRAEKSEAARLVFKEIQKCAACLQKSAEDVKNDIAQDVFINLMSRGKPLKQKTDDATKAAIRTAVQRGQSDYYRKETKQRGIGGSQEVQINDSRNGDKLNVLASANSRLGDRPDSRILEGALESDDALEVTYRFIIDIVLMESISRGPARKRAREAIEQMRAITAEELEFDELVNDLVGDGASEEQRKKARNKIHKDHQRNRDRIDTWIEEQKHQIDGDGVQEGAGGGLTKFDLQLLERAVIGLRSRQASKE